MIVPGEGFRNLKYERISYALDFLRLARQHLKNAGAPAALDKVQRAIKSTEGALRHALNNPDPSKRKVTRRWER
jgi:hypothetical protein